jgi:Iron-containing redox enzyme
MGVTAQRAEESPASIDPRGEPRLPRVRGPLSGFVIDVLEGPPRALDAPAVDTSAPLADDDLQLALYVCYELHYRSFAGVDPLWEWDPGLLRFRAALEAVFETGLREAASDRRTFPPDRVGAALFELAAADPAPSLSRFLEAHGSLAQFREFMVHRSAYQLKEADPHTWAIPRLEDAAKAALVEVQADEYGGGRAERMHSHLFAKAMSAVGLDSAYGAYLDLVPGFTLATVNLISLFGLHRRWRGALVGHLAMFEITSPVPNRRYAAALRRLGFDGRATAFYDEHVEADSVHENIAAYDLAEGLARRVPDLARDIAFGARALLELDGRFAIELLESWDRGESSLLAPLDAPAASR